MSQSRYVPRSRANNFNDVSSFNAANSFNRYGAAPRGRGAIRHYGGRWFPDQVSSSSSSYPNSNNNSIFDIAEKFDDLQVIGGGGAVENSGVINFDAYESVPVEVSGNNVPPPVNNSFAETELEEGLKMNIERCKYVKPTPIQRHAIPIAVAGRDLMACAQTGSGKTAAFCFPIISGILSHKACSSSPSPSPSSMPRRGGVLAYPTALILAPTRELSSQIHDEAKKFAFQTGLKIVVAYGGAPAFHQLRNLERGVDILVATPGRLLDFIEREKVSLTRIKFLALDEADRMLDMGFEPQIRKIVQQMNMPPPGARQTLLFSATFPTDIQRLASDFLSDYIFLSVGRVGSSTELIVQKVELVQDKDKGNRLMNLLRSQRAHATNGKQPLTLVFVETKKRADELQVLLSRSGFAATAIHGDKVQMERERALRTFKSGVAPILVATDVASRGLDIPLVTHVINFDMPKNIDDYVHRIGRTGRAGKSGLATAFFSISDKNIPLAQALVEVLKEAKQEVPSWLSKHAEGSSPSPSDRSYRPQRYGSGNYGGRDFRNFNEPDAENYSYLSAYGNGNHAAESYNTDTTVNIPNSQTVVPSYGIPNAASGGSYQYTDTKTDLCGDRKVEDGPWGYASVVATGWD
ncbi:hypothetical protein RIF29_07730 [Crotalaria pallida]|uniref:RNA helicase n=1 Tax=Crotalaria pallida TaxID=3830 RepID=A0AAN9PC36_CROPI